MTFKASIHLFDVLQKFVEAKLQTSLLEMDANDISILKAKNPLLTNLSLRADFTYHCERAKFHPGSPSHWIVKSARRLDQPTFKGVKSIKMFEVFKV